MDMLSYRTPAASRGAAVALAALLLAVVARPARALTLDYTLTPTQSNVALVVDVDFLGGALTATEQFAGSLTTRYDGTMRADNIGTTAIAFPSGGAALARNQLGPFNIPRQISPAVGGTSGTAAGNYGVTLTAPVGIEVPPIEIPDFGTLNLGTLQSVDVDIALRNVVLDAVTAVHLPVAGGAFDAAQVDLLVTGNVDVNVAAVLRSPDLLSYLANLTVLSLLASSFPELGIGVTGNVFTRDISVGIGTRLALDAVAVPNQAGAGSFTRVADDYVLVLPRFGELAPAVLPGVLDLRLGLDGQLRGVAPVPEPATAALLALGLAALAGGSARRG
jgi:hypothetical protein